MTNDSNENIELEYAFVELPDEEFDDIEYRDNSSYDGEAAELDRIVMPDDLTPVGDGQIDPDDPATYTVNKEDPSSYFKDWNKCLNENDNPAITADLPESTQRPGDRSVQIGTLRAKTVPDLDNCISSNAGNNSGLGTAALIGAAVVVGAAKVAESAKQLITKSADESVDDRRQNDPDDEFSEHKESRGASPQKEQRINSRMTRPQAPATKYSTEKEELESLIVKYFQFGGTCDRCNGLIKPRTNRCTGCGDEVALQGKTIKRLSVGTQLAPWVAGPLSAAKLKSIMFLFTLTGAAAYYVHSTNLGLETGVAAITIIIVAYSILSGIYMGIKKMLIIKRHRDEYIKRNPGLNENIRRNLAKGWFHPEMSIYEMELCGGYRTRPRVKEDVICVEVGQFGSDS